MNETIRVMKAHRCDRSFSGEPVSETMLMEIITAAQCSPNSVNGQQISLVVVRAAGRREPRGQPTPRACIRACISPRSSRWRQSRGS